VTTHINLRKAIAVVVAIIVVFGFIWAVDAFAAPYPTGVGGTGTSQTPASGTIPIGTGAGTYTPALITPGTDIIITNASGSITLAVKNGDFLPSSTVYVSAVNGQSGAVTITSSTLGVATNTLSLFNGNGFTTTTIQSVLNALSAVGLAAYNSSTGVFSVSSSSLNLKSASQYNFSDLLPSSTVYVATVNGQSGAVTISSVATTTINNAQAIVFSLIGDGTTVTSTVNGTTTTFSIINTGNWAGTWQGTNSTTFYLASNPSGYISTSTFNATGTAGYFPLWGALGNALSATSSIFQSGGNVGVGTTSTNSLFNVSGTIDFETSDWLNATTSLPIGSASTSIMISTTTGLSASGYAEINNVEVVSYGSFTANGASSTLNNVTRGLFSTVATAASAGTVVNAISDVISQSTSQLPIFMAQCFTNAGTTPCDEAIGAVPNSSGPRLLNVNGAIHANAINSYGAVLNVCNFTTTCTIGSANTISIMTNTNNIRVFSTGVATDTVLTPYTNQAIRLRDSNSTDRLIVASSGPVTVSSTLTVIQTSTFYGNVSVNTTSSNSTFTVNGAADFGGFTTTTNIYGTGINATGSVYFVNNNALSFSHLSSSYASTVTSSMLVATTTGLPASGFIEYDPNNSVLAQHEIIHYNSLNTSTVSIVGLTRGMFGTSALNLTTSSFIEYFEPIFASGNNVAPLMSFESPGQLGFGVLPVMPVTYSFAASLGTTGVSSIGGGALALCGSVSTCSIGPATTLALQTSNNGVYVFTGGLNTSTEIQPYTSQKIVFASSTGNYYGFIAPNGDWNLGTSTDLGATLGVNGSSTFNGPVSISATTTVQGSPVLTLPPQTLATYGPTNVFWNNNVNNGTTTLNITAVQIPYNETLTGISFATWDVAAGSSTVGLYNYAGTLVASSTGATLPGTFAAVHQAFQSTFSVTPGVWYITMLNSRSSDHFIGVLASTPTNSFTQGGNTLPTTIPTSSITTSGIIPMLSTY
jgi:hypothetical protein